MENYRMNYRNNSCRRNSGAGHTGNNHMKAGGACGCNSPAEYQMPSRGCNASAVDQMPSRDQIHWGDLPPAMAYVPTQKMCKTYSPSKGLQMGTIFPDLCKPFCGKGGGCH